MDVIPRQGTEAEIHYVENDVVDDAALNALFGSASPDHTRRDFRRVLQQSLVYVCALDGARLVGFVNVAWDGGLHAFLLDPTVQHDYRRRGIGLELVRRAGAAAAQHGVEWLHVDYVSELESFYERAGFRPTLAGLLHFSDTDAQHG